MSAWIVSKAHIDAIVYAALCYPSPSSSLTWKDSEGRKQSLSRASTSEVRDYVGRMLWMENLVSVAYRYPDDKDGQRPGPGGLTQAEIIGYTYAVPRRRPSVVEALKLINCFSYQSCEHPGWEKSEALAFCTVLTSALIDELPGYEAAPWGWEDEAEIEQEARRA